MATVDCTTCPHRHYEEGHRSYGANLPERCQGAYFPGDEPGWFCSEGAPELAQDQSVTECPVMVECEYLCPECAAQGSEQRLYHSPDHGYACPEGTCGFVAEDERDIILQATYYIRSLSDQSQEQQRALNAPWPGEVRDAV